MNEPDIAKWEHGLQREISMKTPTQLLLEARRHKDIRDIILDSLERNRATRTMVRDCCIDLGVSWGTFYKWAADQGINISDYHFFEVRDR